MVPVNNVPKTTTSIILFYIVIYYIIIMPAGEAHVVFNALPGMGKDKPLQLKYFLEAGLG